MTHSQKLTRLNFQLEETLLVAFGQHAEELFMTKSKLLLEWLQNTSEVKLIKTDRNTKRVQYQLRISSRLRDQLNSMAKKMSLSCSSLLRNIIKTNLLKTNKEGLEGDLMLITKTYPQIMHYLETAKHKQSMNELDRLLLAVRANLEVGPMQTESIKEDLKKIKLLQKRHSENKSSLAGAKMAEGEFLVITGGLKDGIEVLNQAKVVAYSGGDYVLLSDIYYITALGLHIAGKIDEAIYNYENALEYITLQSEPYRYARIHIHLAMMSMFQLDLKRADLYLAKAHRIINKSETPHYYVILKTVETYLLVMDGKYEEALPRLGEYFGEFKAMQSTFGVYATLQTLAKVQLMAGNIAEAKGIFQKLERQEKLLKQPFSQSRSDFFQMLIQSEQGDQESFSQMQQAIDRRKNHLNVEMEEYLLGSALYLYGDKAKGLKILQRLSKKGSQELLRVNAHRTMEEGKLFPVTVI